MNTLSGNSTGSTKRSLEGYLFIDAANQIHDVGQFSSLGNGSGSYAQVNDCFPSPNNAAYTFNASGEDLMLRVDGLGLKSTTPMVVTVTGTNAVGGGALTGTATFPALAPEDMALQVITAAGAKFATVTNVTATNGVLGDGFNLCTFPNYAAKVEIGFQKGINLDLGTEVSPVYYHYLIDHNKRARRQGKLTIDNLYQNNKQGLSLYNNRACHMVIEIRDDGQASPTEVIFVDKAAGTAKKKWGEGDAEVSETYDGFFGRLFIFS
jgi:hypothetical protein